MADMLEQIVQQVAILFEASPGFGEGKNEQDGNDFETICVAILFEASPGFGASGSLRISS